MDAQFAPSYENVDNYGNIGGEWILIDEKTGKPWGETDRLLRPDVVENVLDWHCKIGHLSARDRPTARKIREKIISECDKHCMIDQVIAYVHIFARNNKKQARSIIGEVIQSGALWKSE